MVENIAVFSVFAVHASISSQVTVDLYPGPKIAVTTPAICEMGCIPIQMVPTPT